MIAPHPDWPEDNIEPMRRVRGTPLPAGKRRVKWKRKGTKVNGKHRRRIKRFRYGPPPV